MRNATLLLSQFCIFSYRSIRQFRIVANTKDIYIIANTKRIDSRDRSLSTGGTNSSNSSRSNCIDHSTRINSLELKMSSPRQRLVWVDLEMTGLDINRDEIIEIACIVTDQDLNVIAEGPNLIINVPDEVLDGMVDWCKQHHGSSGLTKAVRESKIRMEDAEQTVLKFVQKYTQPKECPIAGNSIHVDKRFIDKYMPRLSSHLHYRIVDVSTVKELCRRWYPEAYKRAPKKAGAHRALDDIKESIKEMQYYRKTIFNQ